MVLGFGRKEDRKRDVEQVAKSPTPTGQTSQSMAILVSARPALTEVDDSLMRRLPSNYQESTTVRDVLSYIVGTEAKPQEADVMVGLKRQLGAAGSVITINGRTAKLTDRIGEYLTERQKDVAGKTIKYKELEIEVTAVQQGGYLL